MPRVPTRNSLLSRTSRRWVQEYGINDTEGDKNGMSQTDQRKLTGNDAAAKVRNGGDPRKILQTQADKLGRKAKKHLRRRAVEMQSSMG